MFVFFNGKFDTDTNIMKVLDLNMEPTPKLLNAGKIPNTVALEGFYSRLLIRRIYSFTK